MNKKPVDKFGDLRARGLQSALAAEEKEDANGADLFCNRLSVALTVRQRGNNAVLGEGILPVGFRNVRFRDARTGKTIGEVFRVDGMSVTVASVANSVLGLAGDYGDCKSLRRAPTRDRGVLELCICFQAGEHD